MSVICWFSVRGGVNVVVCVLLCVAFLLCCDCCVCDVCSLGTLLFVVCVLRVFPCGVLCDLCG